MHPGRWLIVGGALTVALALPAPFLRITGRPSVDGFEGAAWPAAAVAFVVAVAVVAGDRRERLSPLAAVAAAGAGAGTTVFAVHKVVDAVLAARDLVAVGIRASSGFGVWLLLAGAVTMLLGAVLGLDRRLG